MYVARLFSKDSGQILDPDLSSPSFESNMLHLFGHLVQQCATSSNNVGSVWPGLNIYSVYQEWPIHKVIQALLEYEDSPFNRNRLRYVPCFNLPQVKHIERALSLLYK